MRRKFFVFCAVLAVAGLCVSCSGASKREFNTHMEGRYRAAQGGMRNIGRFIDRHFFNYTWDDPYAFEDIYAGR